MIRHCVFAKFRADVPEAEIALIFGQLADLKDNLGGILAASFGANVSPEGLGRGYKHGFVMDFRDEAARDAYLTAPAHQAAGGRLVAATDGGAGGILVFDLAL